MGLMLQDIFMLSCLRIHDTAMLMKNVFTLFNFTTVAVGIFSRILCSGTNSNYNSGLLNGQRDQSRQGLLASRDEVSYVGFV
ncbi:hypothetical protein SAMN05421543_1433 [Alicyclobacillus macrosporangiidus]|jgi:hypothetical protein|uniref:Uncharacterized protein n=1 Tax=Alicyclobacillus macrosporangiidus TaxID=392015 RepID=A0A1I7LF04_9BACL|nr:hypothetical protein SAMN05421543_1433 [Alicyclobacillus macrosporangiidus]